MFFQLLAILKFRLQKI